MTTSPQPGAPWYGVDAAKMRFLELHEARCHAIGSAREVRDLGDAVLVFDPHDLEPFWNRAAAIRFPEDRRAFEQRLDELITLFGTLNRRPHVWGAAGFNTPADLGERLEASGFVDVGGGLLMVLADERLARAARAEPDRSDTTLARIRQPGDAFERGRAAADLALVLAESFDLEYGRRATLAAETAAALASPSMAAYLVRVDGEPAAVAKRTTLDGASYLSSIGTRPRYRGRGLGTIVTAAAAQDALEEGIELTYLGVYGENRVARHMYEGLGFATLGGVAGDYLLP